MEEVLRMMEDVREYRAGVPKLVEKLATDLTRSQQFLADKFEEMRKSVMDLSKELSDLRKENQYLKQSLRCLSHRTSIVAQEVIRQEVVLDNEKKAELSTNAIVLGIPRAGNEDTLNVISRTCETLGFRDVNGLIASCTRIPGSNTECNPIRVTFKNAQSKERLMALKKNYGKMDISMIEGIKYEAGLRRTVVIRDDLTPLAMDLLRELKKVQKEKNFRFVWPGRNGTILVKRMECSKPICVRDRADLRKLLDQQ